MKPAYFRYRYITALLFLVLSLASCVEARNKASSSGSTGTVIDFASPLLLGIAILPDGPYTLDGARYRDSLVVQGAGAKARFYIAGEVNPELENLGIDLSRAIEITEAAANALTVRTDRTSSGYNGASVGGVTLITTGFKNKATGVAVRTIFTAVSSIAAALTSGLPVAACYAPGDSTYAVLSGAAGAQLAVTSPAVQTSPAVATVSEMAGIRRYELNTPSRQILIQVNTLSNGCTIQVTDGLEGLVNSSASGYYVSTSFGVPQNDGTTN